MQVSVAIAFILGMFASVEVILVSYLVAPAKTQAILRLLHDWAQTHSRHIMVTMFAVAGLSGVARGTGII